MSSIPSRLLYSAVVVKDLGASTTLERWLAGDHQTNNELRNAAH